MIMHAYSDLLLQVSYLVAGTAFDDGKPEAEIGRILVFEVVRNAKAGPLTAAAMEVEPEPAISLRLLANQEVDCVQHHKQRVLFVCSYDS